MNQARIWTYFITQTGFSCLKGASFKLRLDTRAKPGRVDFIHLIDETYIRAGVFDLTDDTLKIVFQDNAGETRGRATDLVKPAPDHYFMRLERER